MTDANGITTWADLSYSNGVLSVTVPQHFLDTAVYPVKIDPTIGNTTQGASDSAQTGTSMYGMFFNATTDASGGAVTNVQMYGAASTSRSMQGGIYDSSNVPLSPQSSSVSVTSTVQWWVASFAGPTLSAGTQYEATVQGNGSAGDKFMVREDLGSSGDSKRQFAITFGTWPNPATWSASNQRFSIYATYTAAAATTVSSPSVQIKRGPIKIKGGTSIIK